MRYLLLVTALLCPFLLTAQVTLSGDIRNQSTGEALVGASIKATNEDTEQIGISDAGGTFRIDLVPGLYTVSISYVGFETFSQVIELSESHRIEVQLVEATIMTDEVLVTATRAMEDAPITSVTIDKKELDKFNFGQDMPFLLDQLPSVVTTSDAGAGVGYTGIRIRGTDATRINVTINGIQLNDGESQGVFWVDLPDLASSVDDIQVQRGVGTSTNGPGAFGATVNVQTTSFQEQPYADIINSFGSFNTRRHTVAAGTGLLKDHFTVDARLSRIYSNGYIDRAFSDLSSYFLSGAYYSDNTLLRLNVFSGTEQTYQAWYGVPEARLNNDLEGMQQVIINNGLNAEQAENLLTSGRTFNWYIYDNETDNYKQDHYQLLFAQDITDKLTMQGALFHVKGRGFFEQYRWDDAFADYGLDDVIIGGDTITTTDLIRRRWLDNDLYGANLSFDYSPNSNFQLILGGAYSDYSGDHFGEIIWARVAGNTEIRERFYDNVGEKDDGNVFAKTIVQFNPRLLGFADLQYRTVRYTIDGIDITQLPIQVAEVMHFINPKVGLRYDIGSRSTLYTSFGVGNREPDRNDFVDAVGTRVPTPETLYDLELGFNKQGGNWDIASVFYYMHYDNQLVLTGELNDVGANIRTNVDDSYRMGLELILNARIGQKFALGINGTLSQNRIREFEEVLYDYGVNWDEFNVITNTYTNTEIAFSPSVIAGGILSYYPLKPLELSLISKYVGNQYLDNTTNEDRAIQPFFVNNFRATYTVRPAFMKEVGISILVSNLFNQLYESNGYTFGYFGGGNEIRENYLYPQAETHFLGTLTLRF